MIGNRKGMKAEAEYKGKNKPVVGSKTDSILNGNRVLRKYSIGANK
jgi:hypothetical protein